MNTSHATQLDATKRAERDGFTLLEVLLVLLLSATLMMGLWGLASTYTNLYSNGIEQTEEAQLVRTISQMFADDLQSVMQVAQPKKSKVAYVAASKKSVISTTKGGRPAYRRLSLSTQPETLDTGFAETNIPTSFAFVTSTSLPRFGLVGTSTSLQIAVLQPSITLPSATGPEEMATGTDDFAAESSDGTSSAPLDLESPIAEDFDNAGVPAIVRAPELGVIAYSFQPAVDTEYLTAASETDTLSDSGLGSMGLNPDSAFGDDALLDEEGIDTTPPPGLLRREANWETAMATMWNAANSESLSDTGLGTDSASIDSTSLIESGGIDSSEQERQDVTFLDDDSLTLIPEVVSIAFQYSDGQNWYSEWNSWQKKALPVAIEIRFQLMTAVELSELREYYNEEPVLVEDSSAEVERLTDASGVTTEESASVVEEETGPPTGRFYRKVIFLPATPAPERSISSFTDSADEDEFGFDTDMSASPFMEDRP